MVTEREEIKAFNKFLERMGIDRFEYEKIVPSKELWENLMFKWHKEKERLGLK